MRRRPQVALAAVGLLIGYWAVLFTGTHYPKPPRTFDGNEDKLIHLAAFAGLAMLVLAVLRLRTKLGYWSHLSVVAILTVYGAADEWSQRWVGRTCSLGDWLADVAGAVLGAILFASITAAVRRRHKLAKPDLVYQQ